jgi:glucose/arabinose dehydrogenase
MRLARLIVLALVVAGCGAGAGAPAGNSSAGNSSAANSSASNSSASSSSGSASTARAPAKLRLVEIGRFHAPVYVTGAPGQPNRVFVVQQPGQVMLLRGGHRQSRPFLDISKLVYTGGGDEQGLLGLAFSPGYARNGLFYVDYTIANNDVRIVQYQRSTSSGDLAAPASARVVLTIPHRDTNHNGGQLAFGPDGYLYIGVGDGGMEDDPHNNGQNTNTLVGKILRIDPSASGGYTVPRTNPFVGQAGKRPEIWAYGLRNPWRFSFDRRTGDLIIGDVGQDREEEVDLARAGTGAGANYGWSVWEGDRRNKVGLTAPHAVFPVLVALHRDGYCAIIGGYVVRDPSLHGLYGRYLFGDLCHPEIESVQLNGGHPEDLHSTGLTVSSMTSFGQDDSGHIYVSSLRGPVYRLTAG